MAGKSRRKRGKQTPQRKVVSRQRSASAARLPVIRRPSESAAHLEVPSPPATVPRQPITTQTIQHSYIVAELRTIGILAGIMVITLIILYLTLT